LAWRYFQVQAAVTQVQAAVTQVQAAVTQVQAAVTQVQAAMTHRFRPSRHTPLCVANQIKSGRRDTGSGRRDTGSGRRDTGSGRPRTPTAPHAHTPTRSRTLETPDSTPNYAHAHRRARTPSSAHSTTRLHAHTIAHSREYARQHAQMHNYSASSQLASAAATGFFRSSRRSAASPTRRCWSRSRCARATYAILRAWTLV
jgi:hypothetical protein